MAQIKALLDQSIISKAEAGKYISYQKEIQWGDSSTTVELTGITHKKHDPEPDRQAEIEALFTVGRLIREGQIEAYSSSELNIEFLRGSNISTNYNAFKGCEIKPCLSPIERSRFRQTIYSKEFVQKNGKLGQVDFLKEVVDEWSESAVDKLLELCSDPEIKFELSDFEIDGLRDLNWFRQACLASNSPKNYPDMFHVWTAKLNKINIFLTLDIKLKNMVSDMKKSKKNKVTIGVDVLTPQELLKRFGIENKPKIIFQQEKKK